MDRIKIEHQKGNIGEFFIREGRAKEGSLQYHIYNKKMIIDHTEVSQKLRGTGAAKKLVEEAVKFSEEEGYELSSECTYAARVLEKMNS